MACLSKTLHFFIASWMTKDIAIAQVFEGQHIIGTSFGVCKIDGVVYTRDIGLNGEWLNWERQDGLSK